MRLFSLFIAALLISFSPNLASSRDKIIAAVSANAEAPVREIASLYEKQNGVKITIVAASTGKLYGQITQGAPFDVFLSADDVHVDKLIAKDLAIKDTKFAYADGTLSLVHAKNVVDISTLADAAIKRIAIANPDTAPYGRAAIETLKKQNIYDKVKSKLVYGESVAQAYNFYKTGNADAAFVALSLLYGQNDKHVEIDKSLYAPITQEAVLLKKDSEKARKFLEFLKTTQSIEIFKKYGYTANSPKITTKP